jgi:tetratricopeptide (TPR) repeat protein
MLATARQTFTDLGHRLGLLDTAQHSGIVELLDGDASSAEAYLREAVDGYEAMGMRASSARATALLARALLEQGRLDEAEVLADPVLAGDDLKASIGLLGVAAEILAGRGAINEAEALARRAVALAEPTDALVDHADARLALAKVLRAAGRDAESTAELERARALYEAKGATVGVRRCGDVVSSPPVGAVDGVGRRVASNVATRSVDRWVDAMRADDADIDALYRGDCISPSIGRSRPRFGEPIGIPTSRR